MTVCIFKLVFLLLAASPKAYAVYGLSVCVTCIEWATTLLNIKCFVYMALVSCVIAHVEVFESSPSRNCFCLVLCEFFFNFSLMEEGKFYEIVVRPALPFGSVLGN